MAAAGGALKGKNLAPIPYLWGFPSALPWLSQLTSTHMSMAASAVLWEEARKENQPTQQPLPPLGQEWWQWEASSPLLLDLLGQHWQPQVIWGTRSVWMSHKGKDGGGGSLGWGTGWR